MGWLDIPDPVPGKTVVSGELDLAELEETVRCLKAVLASCAQADVAAGLNNLDASSAPSARLPHAQMAVNEQLLGKSSTAASFDPQTLMMEKLQSGVRKANTDVSVASRATHQPTGPRVKWTEKWRTEAEDHNNEAVQCMAFAPLFDRLPGGDGHGGWLVSSSNNLLNLWECNVGKGEPALQLMHSQATEYRLTDVVLERGTQMLLGAAREAARTNAECVALHSLNPEEGMFALKGRLPLPPLSRADPVVRGNPPDHPNARQVESLHTLGGPMKGCVAASYKDEVSVYPTLAVTPSAQPKTTWQPHNGFVSQLHRSSYGIDLFTAAVDGSIHRWDLKAKPKAKQPAAKLQGLAAEVTGLQQVSDKHLLAGSAEGLVAVWDLRRADTPVFRIPAPDGSGVTNVAASPEARLAAFSTAGASIFALTLELESSRGFVSSEVTARPLAAPVKSLAWNTRTQLLMAAVGPSIHVYCKSA